MGRKKKIFFIFYLFCVALVVIVGTLLITKNVTLSEIISLKDGVNPSVLGQMQTNPTTLPTIKPITVQPSPIPIGIRIEQSPSEINEGENATFTWKVVGEPQLIKTTTIYYGLNSDPQVFNKNLSPENSPYTHSLIEFMQGKYFIPLEFIATAKNMSPGTYYFRGYAYIKGKHYWSSERSFTVKEALKHEIRVIDPPSSKKKDENVTFTWEILGPEGTTNYTAIVGGTESKPGPLDNSIETSMTPYKNITTEYISGTHTVPLRFVGNTIFHESSTIYYRAVTKINEKNIWSDEYSLKIE